MECFKESLTNKSLELEKKLFEMNAAQLDTCEMATQTGVIPTISTQLNPSKDVHQTTQT